MSRGLEPSPPCTSAAEEKGLYKGLGIGAELGYMGPWSNFYDDGLAHVKAPPGGGALHVCRSETESLAGARDIGRCGLTTAPSGAK